VFDSRCFSGSCSLCSSIRISPSLTVLLALMPSEQRLTFEELRCCERNTYNPASTIVLYFTRY
jgi:hypothetical protein